MSVNTTYTIDSFFGGVGGIDIGFSKTGRFKTIYINEFDANAVKTLRANFNGCRIDNRDIHDVTSSDVPMADVMVGGFPCQAFSIAGYRKGFSDSRGDLFFEMLRMINSHKPRAIFLENVKNLVTHDNGNTFRVIREALVSNGYFIKWKVLNAKDYGNLPQNRERIYVVGFLDRDLFNSFKFPESIALTTKLSDVIDYKTRQDDFYYYKNGKQPFFNKLAMAVKSQNSIYQWRRQYVRENKSGVIPTLTANMGTGGHNVPIILADHGIRKLTPRESFNAMGFSGDFILPKIARGQLYKQAGNSVAVPVVCRIAQNIAEVLDLKWRQANCWTENDAKYAFYHVKGVYYGESGPCSDAEGAELIDGDSAMKVMRRDKDSKFITKLASR